MSPEHVQSTDDRAAILKRLRRDIAGAPLTPAGDTFAAGVLGERDRILPAVGATGDASAILARQAEIVERHLFELARVLVEGGRSTRRELTYPDSAEGGAHLFRDEALAVLDERLRMLGSDPR